MTISRRRWKLRFRPYPTVASPLLQRVPRSVYSPYSAATNQSQSVNTFPSLSANRCFTSEWENAFVQQRKLCAALEDELRLEQQRCIGLEETVCYLQNQFADLERDISISRWTKEQAMNTLTAAEASTVAANRARFVAEEEIRTYAEVCHRIQAERDELARQVTSNVGMVAALRTELHSRDELHTRRCMQIRDEYETRIQAILAEFEMSRGFANNSTFNGPASGGFDASRDDDILMGFSPLESTFCGPPSAHPSDPPPPDSTFDDQFSSNSPSSTSPPPNPHSGTGTPDASYSSSDESSTAEPSYAAPNPESSANANAPCASPTAPSDFTAAQPDTSTPHSPPPTPTAPPFSEPTASSPFSSSSQPPTPTPQSPQSSEHFTPASPRTPTPPPEPSFPLPFTPPAFPQNPAEWNSLYEERWKFLQAATDDSLTFAHVPWPICRFPLMVDDLDEVGIGRFLLEKYPGPLDKSWKVELRRWHTDKFPSISSKIHSSAVAEVKEGFSRCIKVMINFYESKSI